jgi:hypothetical protein
LERLTRGTDNYDTADLFASRSWCFLGDFRVDFCRLGKWIGSRERMAYRRDIVFHGRMGCGGPSSRRPEQSDLFTEVLPGRYYSRRNCGRPNRVYSRSVHAYNGSSAQLSLVGFRLGLARDRLLDCRAHRTNLLHTFANVHNAAGVNARMVSTLIIGASRTANDKPG